MKKLSALFAAFAAVVALAACPAKDKDKDKDQPKDEPAMKTTETPAPTATTPDPAKPADTTAQPAAQPADTTAKPADPAAKTDVPPECAEYRDVIAKAATCDKLGVQRDELKKAFDASWAAIEKADAAGRTTLATGCKTSAKAVKDALATACP
jgi:hypothetical protein